jgi:hypothetical protein
VVLVPIHSSTNPSVPSAKSLTQLFGRANPSRLSVQL